MTKYEFILENAQFTKTLFFRLRIQECVNKKCNTYKFVLLRAQMNSNFSQYRSICWCPSKKETLN